MYKMYSERLNDSLTRINTVEINDLSEIYNILSDQPYENDIKRNRSPFFYRGLSNSSYSLQNTLQRNCGEKSHVLESVILRNFSKYAINEDQMINESIWRQMVMGQHYGLPTRLLDWTYSPLVALHFAVNDNNPANIENSDCVVWKIDCRDIIETLPDNYRTVLISNKAYLFNIDMLKECALNLEDYDTQMRLYDSIVLMEPFSIDERIIHQRSYFTVSPNHIDCLEEFIALRMKNTVRYLIKKELRWRIRDMLDQMNINERTLLPGLDGLASWLKRYYFVR